MTEKEKLSKFDKELNLIKDGLVKKLTKEIIKQADDWFFIEPASSSGRYHPQFALEAGGLVMHTKVVVYFLKELLRSELYSIDEYHQDMLILSAIAHDIKKYGDGNNTGHTVKNHPELASNYVEKVNKEKKILKNSNDIEYIKKCIITHMGIWGDIKPETEDEKLLHIADLLASRKEIDIKFSEEEKKKTLPNIDDYVLDFGMYKGKLIKEVPIDYLKWGSENIKDNKIFKSLAKQILKENEKNNKQ